MGTNASARLSAGQMYGDMHLLLNGDLNGNGFSAGATTFAGTNRTYIDKDDVQQTAGANVPRYEFYNGNYRLLNEGAAAGNILISKRASFAGDDLYVAFPFGLKCNGLTCTAIDGGIAFIYLKSYEG